MINKNLSLTGDNGSGTSPHLRELEHVPDAMDFLSSVIFRLENLEGKIHSYNRKMATINRISHKVDLVLGSLFPQEFRGVYDAEGFQKAVESVIAQDKFTLEEANCLLAVWTASREIYYVREAKVPYFDAVEPVIRENMDQVMDMLRFKFEEIDPVLYRKCEEYSISNFL